MLLNPLNTNKNETNANSKKQNQDMSESQTHVCFGVKIIISGRKKQWQSHKNLCSLFQN